MIEGWRGRAARTIPTWLLRKHLSAKLRLPIPDPAQQSIAQQRERSRIDSLALAESLGIEVIENENNSMQSISHKDWPKFRQYLESSGFVIDRLRDQHSYAAMTAWSISKLADHPGGQYGDSLMQVGSLWQVFTGELSPNNDAQDFVGKVDIVYTWVDSSDPTWQANYRQALVHTGNDVDASATDIARFTSRDELKYSLRSLETNLPWINHVYVVTAGQRPRWLVNTHSKLSVVDHNDIFADPTACLPTFNSHAIESQLVNIPGLSENFIYVNDDVFFGRYQFPNSFFGPAGQSKYAMSEAHFSTAKDQNLPINRAASNNRDLVSEHFGRTTARKFKHVAHPLRVQVLKTINNEFSERVAKVAEQKFRSDADLSIPSSLAHQFAARLGLGYPTKVNYQYVDIAAKTFYLDMLRLVGNDELDMFCVNEVLAAEDEIDRGSLVRRMLEHRYPVKSSFEL